MIQKKLADERLPNSHIPRMWGGPGNGEISDGCDEIVTKAQMIMEGLSEKDSGVQFHFACFYVWDVERQVLGARPERPGVVDTSLRFSASRSRSFRRI